MKEGLIVAIILLSFSCVGCSNTITEKDILQASNESIKIEDLRKTVNGLNENIYDFIKFDIKEKDYYITELELENMQYEIKKAKENYYNINFELIEKYCKYIEDKGEKSSISYDLNTIQTMKTNFKNMIDLYEKIVQLGQDKSYSNSDYDLIEDYNYNIAKSAHMINLSNKEFEDFFKFYGSFAYDVNKKTLYEIENTVKASGYKYEYEKVDEESKSSKLLKSLIVYNKDNDDSITFGGYLNDSEEYDLTLVQYNIGKTGSTVDISSYAFLGLSKDVEYGGFNFETKEKPEFSSIEEQYLYMNELKSN